MNKYCLDNWKEININEIFDIVSGNGFDFNKMTESEDSNIAYVSRSASFNGVKACVDPVEGVEPFEKGCITIALGGSIGSTFLQSKPFYTGEHMVVLRPKPEFKADMTTPVRLFLAMLIKFECNQRFVAFGRELDTHIRNHFSIQVPFKNEGIDWKFLNSITNDVYKRSITYTNNILHDLSSFDNWKFFKLGDIFLRDKKQKGFPRGKVHSKDELLDGDDYFYVGAKKKENGLMYRCGYCESQISKGNCILFICNGQGSVGYTNYMDVDFMASGDIALGYNEHLNKYNALFLVTILDRERFKYSFGRKWGKYLSDTEILLPAKEGEPDWDYMEEYIKCLPYGDKI